MVRLLSNKRDSKAEIFTSYKAGDFTVLKASTYEEGITVINIHTYQQCPKVHETELQ